jgi:DNA-binding transcriptional MerR regulator
VSQAAELLGVQPAFLRRLETFEAVTPHRTAGGQRRYSRREIEHIDVLSGHMEEGLTLSGAVRIVALQAQVDELGSGSPPTKWVNAGLPGRPRRRSRSGGSG